MTCCGRWPGEARGGDGGLAHPARLYGFLDTATSAITADPGLSSLPALYELAGSLRALPPGGLVFRTVPLDDDDDDGSSSGDGGGNGTAEDGETGRTGGTAGGSGGTPGGAGGDAGGADAQRLFAAVRADQPPARIVRR